MLKWAPHLLRLSIISGFFGFRGASAATAGIAKILFYVEIAITVIVLIIAFAIGQMVF